MRASFNLLCAATLMFALASCAELNNEATGTGNYYGDAGRSLEPLNVAADPETINYLLPRLTAKYRPNNDWTGVTDPRFYLLTEMESNDIDNQNNLSPEARSKRAGRLGEPGASLSIVNSLDVLRNRLLLEIARKKAKEGASRNRQILMHLGKRAFYHRNTGIFDNKV
ncbi:uncharacterized protein LOC109596127 isoform X1 [Aethina tumida]|uniref:uncharacterized protein LOC109596127 isoform X1 n=1 Tax=Aethina tumida TaxID=116153 RepID=UPI00096B3F8D|nr:uncharacterized protein LOC109596127 isoform X1 [Aethina tumida]XP_049822678.1 uncharacterized protein LOC109596127 isoform X1 [Aethina tumida]